jgi:DNA-binding transcriptional ArsR family regulator
MREGPDIARIASLVGDPARASMLTALMGGAALTASELALEAGVGLPTASSHLTKLGYGGLLVQSSQGRHRYFRLSSPQVAAMLESIMGVAEIAGPKRARPGPRDASMREARVCYDHLAGDQAVAMLDGFFAREILTPKEDCIEVGSVGTDFFASAGIDLSALPAGRRPMCRTCLDWSVRRSHLAGSLGAAILEKIVAEKWASRDPASRAVRFTPSGKRSFEKTFLG